VLQPGATRHYDDPAYYTQAYRDRSADVAYYVALARRAKGPVLEYGVGNGRVALPLARAGVTLVGVDASAPMLSDLKTQLGKEAPEVRARVRLREGDMRRVQLKQRFALVIAPFNTLLHLYTRRDVERFLQRVREHLAPGGRFVFDYSMPRVADLAVDPERKYGVPRFKHPSRGLVRYAERFAYDPLGQVLWCNMEFVPADGSDGWRVPLTHRQFFPQELAALLHYNGFEQQSWTADFKDEPPDYGTDSLVVNCRPSPVRTRNKQRVA
jgi:SAM-dependent methyltransferase